MTGCLRVVTNQNLSEKWETRLTHHMRLDLGCEWIHLQGGLGE
jgi:hypothetical protein